MALQDWGFLDKKLGIEPFPFLYGHGLIIKDGFKMSKSRGNIVNPDEYMDKYGVDALRLYLMFIGPYDMGGDFKDTGMKGMSRFLARVEKIISNKDNPRREPARIILEGLRHKTIKRVTEAVEKFKYNVAIAGIMEYVNGLEKYFTPGVEKSPTPGVDSIKTLILLLAPFTPYMAEEWWNRIGEKFSVHQQEWPKFEEKLTQEEKVTIVVQVDGKLRGQLEVSRKEAGDKEKILRLAKENDRIKIYLKDKKIVKEIFVPGKLVNLVVGMR